MMKPLLLIFLLLPAITGFAQRSSNALYVNVEIPYAPANIQLFRGDSLAALMDTADNRKSYFFRELEPANYSVRLKDSILKTFTVDVSTAVEIGITNVGPCLYDHPADYKPKCPHGHSNKIIRIIYGLPLPEEFKKAEKGEVLLAGCTDFLDCHPNFYCKIHKISF